MTYNVYFLYASLVILALVIINCSLNRRSNIIGHRVFIYALIIAFIDVFLDLITSYLISWQKTDLIWLTNLLMTLFIICQFLMPYLFIIYSSRMHINAVGKMDKLTRTFGVIDLILILLTATNPLTKLLFYFDEKAQYIHGPIYYTTYIFAFVCMAIILFRTIKYRKKDSNVFRGFITYMIISFAAIVFQLLNQNIMMVGFGLGLGIMAVYIDISNPLGYLDNLTNLPNRQAFQNWIQQRINPFYCVYLGFSDFSEMNQIYGIHIMNMVLKDISSLITTSKVKHKSFHLSVSKFITVFEREEDAKVYASKLEQYFSKDLIIESTSVKCNIGVCVAKIDEDVLKNNNILPFLDYMLYKCFSKKVIILTDSDKYKDDFAYEQEVERYLATAISNDLFELYLQPIYSVKNRSFVSVEVLSRLKHPDLGYISPQLFISIAERNGSIDHVSLIQFRHLCEFLKANPEFVDRLYGIKYNLSPHELIAHSHATVLPEIIKEFGLPLDKFEFEITESVATEHGDALISSVQKIKDYGIRLNMDDFGSGYANMNVVLKLPFDYLKFDKSLLNNITVDEQAANFYHGQLEIFHRLGFSIVSEGVETEAEYKLLEDWGTDLIQGFYFAKPMPANEALEFFKNN